MNTLVIFAALSLSLPASAETLGFSLTDHTRSGNFTIQVQDDSTLNPLTDAQVTVTDDASSKTKTIRVTREGYANTTLHGVEALGVTVYLKKIPNHDAAILASGEVTGWNADEIGDLFKVTDQAKAGLVLQTLNILDLPAFQSGLLFSPLVDHIDAFGDRSIPSNLVLPDQSFFFGTIHVDKPTYRLPLFANQPTTLYVLDAEGDVNGIVGAIQNGGVSGDILNQLNFTRVGQPVHLIPTASFKQNFSASIDLKPTYTVSAQASPLAQSSTLALALGDLHADKSELLPLDVKVIESAAIQNHEVQLSSGDLGRTHALVCITETAKGKIVTGMINDHPTARVQFGEYLKMSELQDVTSAPTTLSAEAPEHGVGIVVLTQTDAHEKTHPLPVSYDFILPAAGKVTVSLAQVPQVGAFRNLALTHLDFAQAFNPHSFDGRHISEHLARFARSYAKLKE